MSVVLLAPSAALAATINPHVTVEAEYGSVVIEGSVYTAAHHQPSGPYAGRHTVEGGRPSPCNDPAIPVVQDGVILVSHVDLDTFGGCLRALGHADLFAEGYQSFWSLAEFVDTHGAHRLDEAEAAREDVRRLCAYWAWAQGVRRLPRDTVSDITDIVADTAASLRRIFEGDEELMRAGEVFQAEGAALNRASFVGVRRAVIERSSDRFVNHLYTAPDGEVLPAVVAFNTKTGSVTLSLADPMAGVSCREIAQALWGPEAGGHDGIAGSPRERAMAAEDVQAAIDLLNAYIEGR